MSKLFGELFALLPDIPAEPLQISRRGALLGLASIAAPFVIRTPGILMPVRYRPQFYNKWGDRNWKDFPPTWQEYLAYEKSRIESNRQGIMISFSAAGFNQISAMIDAEKRFKAMGML